MMLRKNLGLQEITDQEYVKIMAAWGEERNAEGYTDDVGFAKIIEPLLYSSYYEVLWDLNDTEGVRRVSVNIAKGKWWNVEVRDIGKMYRLRLEENAKKFELLCFGFYHQKPISIRINNEIYFKLIDKRLLDPSLDIPDDAGDRIVVSAFLNIPGYERNLYNWVSLKKPDKAYKIILAAYDITEYGQEKRLQI